MSVIASKVKGFLTNSPMPWLKVVILALASAVLSAVFLIVPIFDNSSLQNIGACFEAWLLLAMYIALNADEPLDAAFKIFVFFLISQPLIYLLQVPFSWRGWDLFSYYPYWLLLTFLTFPAAYLLSLAKDKPWLMCVLICLIEALLAAEFCFHLATLLRSFPYQLLAVLFIAAQMSVYPLALIDDKKKRMLCYIVAAIFIIIFAYQSLAPASFRLQ